MIDKTQFMLKVATKDHSIDTLRGMLRMVKKAQEGAQNTVPFSQYLAARDAAKQQQQQQQTPQQSSGATPSVHSNVLYMPQDALADMGAKAATEAAKDAFGSAGLRGAIGATGGAIGGGIAGGVGSYYGTRLLEHFRNPTLREAAAFRNLSNSISETLNGTRARPSQPVRSFVRNTLFGTPAANLKLSPNGTYDFVLESQSPTGITTRSVSINPKQLKDTDAIDALTHAKQLKAKGIETSQTRAKANATKGGKWGAFAGGASLGLWQFLSGLNSAIDEADMKERIQKKLPPTQPSSTSGNANGTIPYSSSSSR